MNLFSIGQVLTITMGLMSAVACSILIYKAATILNHVKNMKSTLADVSKYIHDWI